VGRVAWRYSSLHSRSYWWPRRKATGEFARGGFISQKRSYIGQPIERETLRGSEAMPFLKVTQKSPRRLQAEMLAKESLRNDMGDRVWFSGDWAEKQNLNVGGLEAIELGASNKLVLRVPGRVQAASTGTPKTLDNMIVIDFTPVRLCHRTMLRNVSKKVAEPIFEDFFNNRASKQRAESKGKEVCLATTQDSPGYVHDIIPENSGCKSLATATKEMASLEKFQATINSTTFELSNQVSIKKSAEEKEEETQLEKSPTAVVSPNFAAKDHPLALNECKPRLQANLNGIQDAGDFRKPVVSEVARHSQEELPRLLKHMEKFKMGKEMSQAYFDQKKALFEKQKAPSEEKKEKKMILILGESVLKTSATTSPTEIASLHHHLAGEMHRRKGQSLLKKSHLLEQPARHALVVPDIGMEALPRPKTDGNLLLEKNQLRSPIVGDSHAAPKQRSPAKNQIRYVLGSMDQDTPSLEDQPFEEYTPITMETDKKLDYQTWVEPELSKEPISRKIHILGTGALGTFIAHSLSTAVNPPPITLLVHRPLLMQQWHDEGAAIRVVKNGMLYSESTIDLESCATFGMKDPTMSYPGFGKNLEHTAEPPNTVIENLIVTTPGKITEAALMPIKHRLRPYSTLCFLQDGLGIIERVNHSIFPDPETRPEYMLGSVSHRLLSTSQAFTTAQIEQGKVVLAFFPDRKPTYLDS